MATSKKAKFAALRVKQGKGKRLVKPALGHMQGILGKGAAHTDSTKYTRKEKHNDRNTTED